MRSVVMKLVTADRSPDGTAASRSQRARRRQSIRSARDGLVPERDGRAGGGRGRSGRRVRSRVHLPEDQGRAGRQAGDEDHDAGSPQRPLRGQPEGRLDQERVGKERGERSGVAQGVEPVGVAGSPSAARMAASQELSSGVVAVISRAGAPIVTRRIQTRLTTAGRPTSRRSPIRTGARTRRPRLPAPARHGRSPRDEARATWPTRAHRHSRPEHGLEEEEHGGPHRRRAAERRQRQPSDQRLHREQEERRQRDRGREHGQCQRGGPRTSAQGAAHSPVADPLSNRRHRSMVPGHRRSGHGPVGPSAPDRWSGVISP